MARHKKHENDLPQENCTKERRAIQNIGSNRTSHLPAKTNHNMENSQHVPHLVTPTIQGKQSLQSELPKPPLELMEGEEVQSGEHIETPKKGQNLPILHEMEGILHL